MTVLEVGPAAVRYLPSGDHPRPDPDCVRAALTGIDDTTVLLHERPVAVAQLWRHILSSAPRPTDDVLTLVHPSWWPPTRIARLAAWAGTTAPRVETTPRSALMTRLETDGISIEIGTDVVAICRGAAPPEVLSAPVDPTVVAARILDTGTGCRVRIDAPHGVAGGAEMAEEIRKALSDSGIRATVSRIEDLVQPACSPETRRLPSPPARRVAAPLVAATAVATVLGGLGLVTGRSAESASDPAPHTVELVEGRVAVRVPAGWRLRRITAGPGSRRVELTSVTDPSAALHITQSYAPGQTHDGVVDTLEQAIGLATPGVFADFDPDGRRAGRQVVAYREARTGRAIEWFVLLDGATRIGIGCQSAPGRIDAVSPACDQAVGSAHESRGTDEAP